MFLQTSGQPIEMKKRDKPDYWMEQKYGNLMILYHLKLKIDMDKIPAEIYYSYMTKTSRERGPSRYIAFGDIADYGNSNADFIVNGKLVMDDGNYINQSKIHKFKEFIYLGGYDV